MQTGGGGGGGGVQVTHVLWPQRMKPEGKIYTWIRGDLTERYLIVVSQDMIST